MLTIVITAGPFVLDPNSDVPEMTAGALFTEDFADYHTRKAAVATVTAAEGGPVDIRIRCSLS